MNNIFSTYLKAEQLPDNIKLKHKIKIGAKVPRYDVTKAAGLTPPFESLKNSKGQIIFYLNETRGIINSPDQRRADRFLMSKDSLNFSSVFLYDYSAPLLIGYGNANTAPTFGQKHLKNPFCCCKNDGYLFAIAPDWATIEIFVLPNSKNTILANAKEFADGIYDEAINEIRTAAKTFFEYI